MIGVNNSQMLDPHLEVRNINGVSFHVTFGKYSHVFPTYQDIIQKVQTSRVGRDLRNVTIQLHRFYQANQFNYVKYKEEVSKRFGTFDLIDRSISIGTLIVSSQALGIVPSLFCGIFIKGYKYVRDRKQNIVKELYELDAIIEGFKRMCQTIPFDDDNVMSERNQNLICYYSIFALLIWTMEQNLQKHRRSFPTGNIQRNNNPGATCNMFEMIYRKYF